MLNSSHNFVSRRQMLWSLFTTVTNRQRPAVDRSLLHVTPTSPSGLYGTSQNSSAALSLNTAAVDTASLEWFVVTVWSVYCFSWFFFLKYMGRCYTNTNYWWYYFGFWNSLHIDLCTEMVPSYLNTLRLEVTLATPYRVFIDSLKLYNTSFTPTSFGYFEPCCMYLFSSCGWV